jgi:hypothetical protein
VAERVQVREITDEEGQRLLRILRRSTGSVVTWRRAQMVLLSAQAMPVPKIAEVTVTSPDRVRDALPRRAPTHLHTGPAAPDQADGAIPPDRPRAAVFDPEPGQAGRVPGR